MIAESQHFEVIDLPQCDVNRQSMTQVWILPRIGSFVVRMYIAGQRVLFMGEVYDSRIRRKRARGRCIRVPGVPGQQPMIFQIQQPDVSPITGMKFLPVKKQGAGGGSRIGRASPKIADVRNSLLFVHDQVLDDGEVFRFRLLDHVLRRIAVLTSIVHVDMDVSTHPAEAGIARNIEGSQL